MNSCKSSVILYTTGTNLYFSSTAEYQSLETLINRILFKQQLETEGLERDALANEMLAHGFDPVQTQRMQHSRGAFHHAQHRNGEDEPEVEGDHDHHDLHAAGHAEGAAKSHVPQHDGELLMRE